jgi:hypothetical protein
MGELSGANESKSDVQAVRRTMLVGTRSAKETDKGPSKVTEKARGTLPGSGMDAVHRLRHAPLALGVVVNVKDFLPSHPLKIARSLRRRVAVNRFKADRAAFRLPQEPRQSRIFDRSVGNA